MTCMLTCEECGTDAGPHYHCDYCTRALCHDCRPRRKHVCEED